MITQPTITRPTGGLVERLEFAQRLVTDFNAHRVSVSDFGISLFTDHPLPSQLLTELGMHRNGPDAVTEASVEMQVIVYGPNWVSA